MVNREKEKHFGLRVNGDILAKFRYVCSYEGRSANSQIIQLMLKFIADYEKEHGIGYGIYDGSIIPHRLRRFRFLHCGFFL